MTNTGKFLLVVFKEGVSESDIEKMLSGYKHDRLFDESFYSKNQENNLSRYYTIDIPDGSEKESIADIQAAHGSLIERISIRK